MIRAIEHTAIAAQDTAALARWYCETLGFHPVVEGGQGIWFIAPPEGQGLIEIVVATDAPRTARHRNDPGWSHLAFTVTDFDATVASLTAKGVTFTGPPSGRPGQQRLAFFLDLEGNVLQIVERSKPLGSPSA
jgi:catechol 2,3-dioxygenase-like lactoylglutathione lyase family enzyme